MNDSMSIINNVAPNNLSFTNDTAYTSILDILQGGWALNTGAVLLILLALCLISYIWRKRIKGMSYTTVLTITVIVFLAGVVIYTTGALQSENMGFWDAVYTIPSAIISSLGMFVYQDDISELSDRAKHCSEFMAAYSIIHLFAAVITSLLMIKWVGMLVYYKWRLFTIRRKSYDTYVFWGINPASLTLAKSILAESKKKHLDKPYIVFVNTVDDGEETGVSIHRLLDIIKLKSDVDKQITDMGATVTNCYVNLDDRSFSNIRIGLVDFLRKYAKLTLLSKRVSRAKSLHIFLLSSDEGKNINAVGNLANIAEHDKAKRPTHLYCHARRSALTQVFENKDLLSDNENLHLHIVDSAQLSIQCLKRNMEDCPVSFVEVDKGSATVSSAFHSMIIGFGETGEEAFNFLYEFGAFVDEKGMKTPFRCTIIDKQATALRENLLSKALALCDDGIRGVDTLNFVNAEMGGEDFWPTVEKEIKDGLCYVVLAINDDNACLNTAIEICSRAMRWRSADAKQLNVYVRCYNPQNYTQMASVAQDMQEHYEGIKLKIIGGIDDIFNYETIVDERYLKEAKLYNWEYSKHEPDDVETAWNEGIKKRRTKDNPTIGNIEDSYRRLGQNVSNAQHKDTKLNILLRADYPLVYWKEKDLSRETNTPLYPNLNNEKDVRVLHNIARLEHERWMASMVLQGWRPTPKSTDDRDVRQKLHEDIRPWNELRSEGALRLQYQGYDCDVVDTSIRLKLAEEAIILNAREAMSNYDTTKAFHLLLHPDLDGNVEARRVLTVIADTFDMLFNVDVAAFEDVKDKADKGDAFAQYLMSRFYRVKQVDIEAEVHYATMSAKRGDSAGIYALSQCYEEGRGVACLKKKAEELRARAAELGHPAAMVTEARLLLSPWSEKYDEARGLQLLRRCMTFQIAESFALMAKLYSTGKAGVTEDLQEAERLYRLAISGGYPQAYNDLASDIYWESRTKDPNSMYEQTLRKGMEHNVPLCFYMMAQRYFGKDTEKDIAQAVEWYGSAANLGYMAAYSVLGNLYKKGNGVAVDMEKAWHWYSRGAEYYDPDCLREICGMIEPDSLSMIIRPADEAKSPYDEWFKAQQPANMFLYKERLSMTGAQEAADAACWLYEAYRDGTKKSSELMDIMMHGRSTHGNTTPNEQRAMTYIRRAAELNQSPEHALIFGLLATQKDNTSGAYDTSLVKEGIAQLEKVTTSVSSCQKIWAVIAAVRLAELYSDGELVDTLKALQYRHAAVVAGYEASLNPIQRGYESSYSVQYAEEKYGTQCLEQAREAMSRFDMETAFRLLAEPSFDYYYEARRLLATIARNDENLLCVSDEAFNVVRRHAHYDSFAQYLMARYYSVKHNNPNLRILYAAKSAEHGDNRGLYELGCCMAMNSMSEADENKARKLMDKHVERDNHCAQLSVSDGYPQAYADMALSCRTTVGDTAANAFTPQGLHYLDQGIALGMPCCMNLKAQHFEICEDGNPRDISESIRLYKMAAERAHIPSIVALGDIFYEGRKTSANPAESWRWYSLGAAQGDAKCMYSLGQMCLEGNGGEGLTPKDSIGYFEKALLLGTVYGAKAAHALFSIYGSKQLNPPAEFDIMEYSTDFSCPTVAENDTVAMKYLKYAADVCFFPEDTLYYGLLLTTPNTQFTDVTQGVTYLERAFNENETLAAVRLGDLYANGIGVGKDIEKARSYYSIAAKQQNVLAKQRIEQLNN